MEPELQCFRETLAEWRHARQLKIATAARMLGVGTATWGHWEEGRRFPSIDNMILLARFTGIPLRHFLCPNRKRCPFRD